MRDVTKRQRSVSAVENQNSEVDLISDLHDNLIEAILVKLPLGDAARTCILSRRWRNIWPKLPSINIDSVVWEKLVRIQGSLCPSEKPKEIMAPILKHRKGPIIEFTLDISELKGFVDINPLVSYIAEEGVESFFLRVRSGRPSKLTSAIFTCPTLTDLWLHNCEINLPTSSFTGLNRLTQLVLGKEVVVSPEVLGSLISGCPSLKLLSMQTSIDIQKLHIVAPSIISLYCYYHHRHNSRSTRHRGNGLQAGSSIPNNMLNGLLNLEYLYTDAYYIKFLAVADWIREHMLQTCMQHLKFIFLYKICLDDVDQYACVLRLIRSSPNLEKIRITLQADKAIIADVRKREVQDHLPLTLHSLQEVEVSKCVGRISEMILIRILLESSPKLKSMKVELNDFTSTTKKSQILEQINIFKRSSPMVKVDVNYKWSLRRY